MERKKGERYSEEFRREAVQKMKSCDNILKLSRELGIHRRLLYNWRERLDESNPAPLRSREPSARKSPNSSGCSRTRPWKWIFSDVPCKK